MSDSWDPQKKDIMTHLEEAEAIRQQLNDLHIPKPDIKQTADRNPTGHQAAKGFAASMHIVSGVLVGGLLGYGFDILCNTSPFGLVIMLPIGMAAGFRNMIRTLDADDKEK